MAPGDPVAVQCFDCSRRRTGGGQPQQVAEKLARHSEALGGVDRFTFQMDNAGLSHQQLLQSIELIGEKVIPLIKQNA
jgi:alkanesulfonate monooxygenase SsuD/methylene tetrahydromethanopterin reductase-like flavin-dependent oxidoreductase (luciferase family)